MITALIGETCVHGQQVGTPIVNDKGDVLATVYGPTVGVATDRAKAIAAWLNGMGARCETGQLFHSTPPPRRSQ